MKSAKFEIGQNIIHIKQQYRGVVVDADENFLTSSGHQVSTLGSTSEKSKEPWYRILVDESDVISYVRESMLEADFDETPIDNPKMNEYLRKNKTGHYIRQEKLN